MRVGLLYLDALQGGGYPRDVRWLSGALQRQGVEVTLIANPGPREDGLDSTTVMRIDELDSIARQVDVLHVWFLFVPGQLHRWRTIRVEAPLVVTPGAQLLPHHLRRRWWKKMPYLMSMQPTLLRRRPAAHLFSEIERRSAGRWMHPSRWFEASLGVFPVHSDAEPGIDLDDYLLFFGRNDVYQKGIDILLRGFATASRGGLDIPLVIAGQPFADSVSVLSTMIDELGISQRVHILGEVSEERKNRLIRGARCLVFLSRWDGPPRPIREAVALDTPMVVSRETMLGGVVEAAGAGRQVDLDPRNVADALLETRDDRTIRRWSDGVGALRGELSWDRVAERYISGYQLLAG